MDSISKSLLITLPSGKQAFKRGAVVFQDGGGFSDFIIRMAQGFRGYTHCGIALGDGKMIAAWGGSNGVVLQDDLQQMVTEARMLPEADIESAIALATKQMGKPYDYPGLLGCIGLPTWGQGPPTSFICSSLVEYCVSLPKVTKAVRVVMPQDVWNALNTSSVPV